MPLLANAKKALRSSRRKQIVNSRVRSKVRTSIDAVIGSASVATKEGVSSAFSALDTAVKKNLLHRNKAARLKRQLSRRVSQA